MIDPNQFIIARKRKKYRFAKFANSPLCFEFDEFLQGSTLQKVDILEIGAGTGLFSVELAAKHPKKQVIAIDVKADRLQKGAYVAEARDIKNVHFVRMRADQITEVFKARSIETIWLTFPDPFPRKRSAKRRLTHPLYLEKYQMLLKKSGALLLKHDNIDFFHWSLEQLVAHGWCISELSFDLHGSGLSEDNKVRTTYEKRWISEGLAINFVRAVFLSKMLQ